MAKGTQDRLREEYLSELGCFILRFRESEVLNSLDSVKTRITHAVYSLKIK